MNILNDTAFDHRRKKTTREQELIILRLFDYFYFKPVPFLSFGLTQKLSVEKGKQLVPPKCVGLSYKAIHLKF